MKKKKQKSFTLRKIIGILLVLIVICYGGRMVWAATVPSVTITFADNNLYESLKNKISYVENNDNTKTLKIAISTIENTKELDLSGSER